MTKVDFKKKYKSLYKPSAKDFSVVEVPPLQYLMIDGHGTPGNQAYQDALAALYAVAYKLKFASKQELARDYVVPPLQGLWWAEDMDHFTVKRDKSKWDWTMMIMTPNWIDGAMFDTAVSIVRSKKNPVALPKLRLETYDEGLCAQIMHIGSYDDEGPTLATLHNEWMPENDYIFNGKHHEIYLSDPRKTAPEKLKTILRQPIRKTIHARD